MYIHNISFKIWSVLSIWPLVWGWYTILKLNWVSYPSNKSFQKLEVRFVSLSDITIFGIPYNLKIYFINISTMLMDLMVYLTSMKCVPLVNLSSTTIIESFCLLVLGKPMMKSMVITSHFHSRIGKGCKSTIGCWCWTLIYWHSMYLAKCYGASNFMLGQWYSFLNDVITFWYLGWPKNGILWNSFKTNRFKFVEMGINNMFLNKKIPSLLRLKYNFSKSNFILFPCIFHHF